MEYKLSDKKRESQVLDFLRFPFIVIVLYMHIIPLDPIHVSFDMSWSNLYNWIASLISHNLGRAVVPCFFVISGYFYFLKMQKWDKYFYYNQQKKRLKTLVVPYIIFNTINILLVVVKGYVMRKIYGNVFYVEEFEFLDKYTLLDFYWRMPIDLPLWFLRDLIVMSFFSPVFFYLFKYTKIVGLFFLFLLYYLNIEHPIGLSVTTTSILFFGIGAYLGINKISILNLSRKYRCFVLPITIITLLISTYLSDSQDYALIAERIYIPFGIISFVIVSDILITCDKLRNLMLSMAPTVFFIYAIHEFYLKNWIKGAFYRTPLSASPIGMIIGYLIMPMILLFICLALYKIMNRFIPNVLKVMCGNR